MNGEVLYEQEEQEYLEYIYVLGKHFARVDGNLAGGTTATYFYHTDHLGSAVLVTDGVGEVVWSAEYTPFGQIALEEGVLDKAAKFTGKDLDLDTGLYYFNARWYDQVSGRFTREDDYKGDVLLPLTQHPYIYAMGNPLRYTDPSGNINVEGTGGGEGTKTKGTSWN